MIKKIAGSNPDAIENNNRLIKQALEENALKLELLNRDQALKMAKLNKVQQELDELNRLYPMKKPGI